MRSNSHVCQAAYDLFRLSHHQFLLFQRDSFFGICPSVVTGATSKCLEGYHVKTGHELRKGWRELPVPTQKSRGLFRPLNSG
jgi:hypothetical protein